MFRSEGIIGHAAQLRLLSAWVERPAPGYLFVGPARLGKRMIAERFAAALLGLDQDALPAVHSDLVRLEPEEGKSVVSVERVREARLRLAERPMVAARVVVFIPAMNRLNEEGMNALLKVLEEPPAGAAFVCVSESLNRIPATVKSRLVILPFTSVPRQEIEEGLRARGISFKDLEDRLLHARGRPGLAIDPQKTETDLSERFFAAKTTGERFSIIDRLAKVCDSSDNTVDAWNEALDEWSESFRVKLAQDPRRAYAVGTAVIVARSMVGGALSPRLALDAAALRLAMPNPLINLFPSHLSRAFHPLFL
jgi:hypothetical protein